MIPDAEVETVAELGALGVQAGTQIPVEPKPDVFIRVLQTGGTVRDVVTTAPVLTVEVFARNETVAAETANQAVTLLMGCPVKNQLGNAICYRLQVLSLPQNFPMPSLPDYFRFQFTISPELRKS